MRAVIQRVTHARVEIEGAVSGTIERGLLVLLGIEDADSEADIDWLCNKLLGMRIFSDADGKMNLSVEDIGGGLLVVSQFTLYASTKKGNRPGFTRSAGPPVAIPLYERFVERLGELARTRVQGGGEGAKLPVQTGRFVADMQVHLLNDGPVTIIIDTNARE